MSDSESDKEQQDDKQDEKKEEKKEVKREEKEEVKESKQEVKESKQEDKDAEWKSHLWPHGEFQVLSDGEAWIIEGSLKNGPKRNMVVYKMKNTGGLFLHSVVCLNEEAMQKLESFGKPEIILIPHTAHTIDAGIFKKRYPDAKLFGPKKIKDVLLKEKRLTLDGFSEDIPKETGVTPLIPEGLKRTPVGVELTFQLELAAGKALIFCDLIINATGAKGPIKFFIGSSFVVPRFVRWIAVNDKSKFKAWLLKLADTENLQAVCSAHGAPITKDCAQQFKDIIKRSYE